MLLSACGGSYTVHVYDNARVLDSNRVQNEASSLSYPINIYTFNNFTGTKSSFDQQAVNTINNTGNPNLIVIAIDTKDRYLAIVGGKNVSTSNGVYNDAVNAFRNNFNGGDYTGATIAAIDSLRGSLGGGFGFLPGLLVAVLVIAGIAVLFGVLRRRRRIGGYGVLYQQPYGQPYQPPYNQGYPPNYCGPGYNQGPGVNPWVAGSLGAAAGGFIGYELGKE